MNGILLPNIQLAKNLKLINGEYMFNFELTLEEANLILAALGKAPFEQVAGLIGKLKDQAQPQLERVQAEIAAQQGTAAEEAPAA